MEALNKSTSFLFGAIHSVEKRPMNKQRQKCTIIQAVISAQIKMRHVRGGGARMSWKPSSYAHCDRASFWWKLSPEVSFLSSWAGQVRQS